MKRIKVLIILIVIASLNLSGCVDYPPTSNNPPGLKTIFLVSIFNNSLNYSEIVAIQKEKVETELQKDGYEIVNYTTGEDFYLQVVLRNYTTNENAIIMYLNANRLQNGSTIAKYSMVFDPKQYNGSTYKENQKDEILDFMKTKAFDFAKVCNITINFNGDYWGVSYIEDYD